MSREQPRIPLSLRVAWVIQHNEWKDLLYLVCLNPKPARGSHLRTGGRLHLHLLGIFMCLCVCKCTRIHLFFSSVHSVCVLEAFTTCPAHVCQVVNGTRVVFISAGGAQRPVASRRWVEGGVEQHMHAQKPRRTNLYRWAAQRRRPLLGSSQNPD